MVSATLTREMLLSCTNQDCWMTATVALNGILFSAATHQVCKTLTKTLTVVKNNYSGHQLLSIYHVPATALN